MMELRNPWVLREGSRAAAAPSPLLLPGFVSATGLLSPAEPIEREREREGERCQWGRAARGGIYSNWFEKLDGPDYPFDDVQYLSGQ